MREAMWAKVASRKHTIYKVFPFGSASEEVMLYGTVALSFKDGTAGDVDWAARAELTKATPDGKYRMKFYQVYLVRVPGALHSFRWLADLSRDIRTLAARTRSSRVEALIDGFIQMVSSLMLCPNMMSNIHCSSMDRKCSCNAMQSLDP